MAVNFKLEGLDQVQSKLDLLANPKKAKSIARKAARQAMNIARDVARSAARNLDDPITSEKIYKEILLITNIMYNIKSSTLKFKLYTVIYKYRLYSHINVNSFKEISYVRIF